MGVAARNRRLSLASRIDSVPEMAELSCRTAPRGRNRILVAEGNGSLRSVFSVWTAFRNRACFSTTYTPFLVKSG